MTNPTDTDAQLAAAILAAITESREQVIPEERIIEEMLARKLLRICARGFRDLVH